jgi:hypothetical protein
MTLTELSTRRWPSVAVALAGLYGGSCIFAVETFETRIDLPQSASAEWTVRQLVSVSVRIRARDALVLHNNGAFVVRVNDDNVAERIAVELGDSSGEIIAVAGPLHEGDRVPCRTNGDSHSEYNAER